MKHKIHKYVMLFVLVLAGFFLSSCDPSDPFTIAEIQKAVEASDIYMQGDVTSGVVDIIGITYRKGDAYVTAIDGGKFIGCTEVNTEILKQTIDAAQDAVKYEGWEKIPYSALPYGTKIAIEMRLYGFVEFATAAAGFTSSLNGTGFLAGMGMKTAYTYEDIFKPTYITAEEYMKLDAFQQNYGFFTVIQ
jgi:hypothetical protein